MIIHLLNDLGNYFVTLIINMSIGGSILLLAILILSTLFRQKSASFHYFLWLIGLFPFILPQGIPLPTFFEKNIHFSSGFSTTSRLILHSLAGLDPQRSGCISRAS